MQLSAPANVEDHLACVEEASANAVDRYNMEHGASFTSDDLGDPQYEMHYDFQRLLLRVMRENGCALGPPRFEEFGEAYQYAYDATLRATSRTFGQHDVGGHRRHGAGEVRAARAQGRAGERRLALQLGPWLRSALPNAQTPCVGAFAAYALELEHFGLRSRAGACTSHFSNQRVDAVTNEYDLELRVARSADVSFVSLELALGAGTALCTQRFDTHGSAAARNSLSPYLLLGAGARAELGAGYALGLDVAGETHFLRLDSSRRGSAEFAARVSLVLGKSF